MQKLGLHKDHEIHAIPNTAEKYISFSIKQNNEKYPVTLQFIDTLAFLKTSLAKLVANLEKNKFSIFRECIQSPHIDLLLKKGIYPYEYMDSFSKFAETALPHKDAFYSTLSNDGITDEEYEHTQSVWRAFNIRDMGEYHDLYLKTDVLILVDVFENFRCLTLDCYKLDTAHMMTSPGLAWQAALKMTDVQLDLFTDIDMHLFIEKGTRGGVSMISHRYSKANIPGTEDYDVTEPNRHILYLDANNLYGMYSSASFPTLNESTHDVFFVIGWAMSQPLPVSDFEWVEPSTLSEEDIRGWDDHNVKSLIRCICINASY